MKLPAGCTEFIVTMPVVVLKPIPLGIEEAVIITFVVLAAVPLKRSLVNILNVF